MANGQLFHPEHIRCHQCQKPVDPNMTGLVERKGKFYCQTDFNNLYLPKCTSCHRVIEKEAIKSSDDEIKGYWHKECFQCQVSWKKRRQQKSFFLTVKSQHNRCAIYHF